MTKIAVAGSINTDFVVRTSRFPLPGETVVGESFAIYGGGKGANQAIAAARMGAHVEFFGAVGRDVHSSDRLNGLAADGVDTRHVARVDGYGGIAVIQVDSSTGQNSITLVSGANARVAADSVRTDLAASCGLGDIICLQLEIPFESVRAALEVGRQVGSVTVLNAVPFDPAASDLLSMVDVLIVNEIEAGQLLGSGPISVSDTCAAAARLKDLGIREAVIITLGSHGAWVSGDSFGLLVPAREVTVVDTTGAGDAFCGAFCAWLASGESILDAVKAGTIAGSLAVQRHGAQPSLPARAEVDQILSAG